MKRKERRIKEFDKLINSFIHQSRRFINYAAFTYGISDYLITGVKNEKLTYDYEYFAFTKSTKTLISIRELLKENHNEDVLILSRSIFESYLATRYFNENPNKYEELIFNPIGVALAEYNLDSSGNVYDRKGIYKGKQENPSKYKIGTEKKYYYDLYTFMCNFAHCNFGVFNCYIDNVSQYTIKKVNYPILTRFIVLFVFTRLFEHVVTVDGEDFINKYTERKCYDLVKQSNCFLKKVAEEIIQSLTKNDKNNHLKHKSKRMIKMIKNMKKALTEEVGSVKKN